MKKDLAIRTALGASRSAIRRLIWRDGLVLTLTGIGIGTLGGLSLKRLLSSLLFDVAITDSLTWAIVAGVLAIAIIAGSWRPTRAAVLTAPMVLLREE